MTLKLKKEYDALHNKIRAIYLGVTGTLIKEDEEYDLTLTEAKEGHDAKIRREFGMELLKELSGKQEHILADKKEDEFDGHFIPTYGVTMKNIIAIFKAKGITL